jgi:hypothetical protein
VPSQSRKRKVRKQQQLKVQDARPVAEERDAEIAVAVAERPESFAPSATPSARRAAARRAGAEAARQRYGQLPTFDRAFLMRELRLISTTSIVLFALIVVLAILLR